MREITSTSGAVKATRPVIRALTACRDIFNVLAIASWLARFSAATPRILSAMYCVSSFTKDRMTRSRAISKDRRWRVVPQCPLFVPIYR